MGGGQWAEGNTDVVAGTAAAWPRGCSGRFMPPPPPANPGGLLSHLHHLQHTSVDQHRLTDAMYCHATCNVM